MAERGTGAGRRNPARRTGKAKGRDAKTGQAKGPKAKTGRAKTGRAKPRAGTAPALGARRAMVEWSAPILERAYPDTRVTLDYETPLQLLVATILSAQCTDERVNRVTPALFERYSAARDFAEADRDELEERIRPTGFFRNKARHLREMARVVVEEHGGRVPDTMDELLALPGVARKTANVVLSNAFGKLEGVVVDTHVRRVSGRLGLTEESDPAKIERDLMEAIPRPLWRDYAWRILLHGRHRCHARRPDCTGCELAERCPSAYSFG